MEDIQIPILIVDDHISNCTLLEKILTQYGYKSVSVYNGTEALQHINDNEYLLILLDIELPDILGLDILKKVREKYSYTDLPIIMVTAQSDTESIVKAFELDANDYIHKPIKMQELIARINTQVRLKEQQKQLNLTKDQLEAAIKGSNDGIWDWNITTGKVYYSDQWLKMLGYNTIKEIDNTLDFWIEQIHPKETDIFKNKLNAHIAGNTLNFDHRYRLKHKNNNYIWVHTRGCLLKDNNGLADRMSGSQYDVTSSMLTETTTGLANNLYFSDQIQTSLDKYKKNTDNYFSVLVINIYNTQTLLQAIGQESFNKIIHDAGKIIYEISTKYPFIFLAYLGENNFGILIPEKRSLPTSTLLARNLIEVLNIPFNNGKDNIFLSVHIGIASVHKNYAQASTILIDAITAATTNVNKKYDDNQISIYDASFNQIAKDNLILETELHDAILNNEFILYYQPIVDSFTGKIHSFEALLRWQHPEKGLLTPDCFIAGLEKFKLIDLLTEQIITSSISVIKKWTDNQKLKTFSIHINISPSSLQNEKFKNILMNSLLKNKAYLPYIKLEITEDLMINSYSSAQTLLKKIKELGVKIALDDFGKGYSSLTHIQQLNFDTIKIDKAFIDNNNEQIISMIINLAHSMNMNCVAEGVETKEQLEMLQHLECDSCQGYYFSKPIPEIEAMAYLEQQMKDDFPFAPRTNS